MLVLYTYQGRGHPHEKLKGIQRSSEGQKRVWVDVTAANERERERERERNKVARMFYSDVLMQSIAYNSEKGT
jgi:hypothetical protein